MVTTRPKTFIDDIDIRKSYGSDAAGNISIAEYIARPRNLTELQECVRYCQKQRIAITPAGGQSCYTASALAETGVLLSTQRMKRIIDVDRESLFVDVEPGVVLAELKRELASHNLYYPVDPSSEEIATVGGNVATNASGPRTLRYGTTRDHVLELDVMLADGTQYTLKRSQSSKVATGPLTDSAMLDLFVGSEGILGIITRIRLSLLPHIPKRAVVIAYFEKLDQLLSFIAANDQRNLDYSPPSAIEYFDQRCLSLMNEYSAADVPASACGALYIEFEDGDTNEHSLEKFLSVLTPYTPLSSQALACLETNRTDELRRFRSFVPEKLNELAAQYHEKGGKKVSTDWAVPVCNIELALDRANQLIDSSSFPDEQAFCFGHLGNGHPHFNLIAHNTEQLEEALDLSVELSKLALSLGGTVAAEHGIGKQRKNLLALEQTSFRTNLLRAIKKELDPLGIMAPGNIL